MQTLDEIAGHLAGIAGALVSARLIEGSPMERISYVASGGVFAYFASEYLSDKTGIPEGLAGFLVGFLGLAIAAKAWEAIQSFPAADVSKGVANAVSDRVRSILGGRRGGE